MIERKTKDIITERGYDRIIEYPEYILWGAGEGETQRFTKGTSTNELHSTLGTILFSYGIIGLVIMTFLLKKAIWGAPLGIWLVMISPFAYGLTHNGMRQPLFWGTIMLVALAVKRSKVYVEKTAD